MMIKKIFWKNYKWKSRKLILKSELKNLQSKTLIKKRNQLFNFYFLNYLKITHLTGSNEVCRDNGCMNRCMDEWKNESMDKLMDR